MKYDCRHYIKMAYGNRPQIEESEICGCYYCETIMNKEQVEFLEEKDGRYTGVCPHCGIDSIVTDKGIEAGGEELTLDLLREIRKKAFW